MPAMLVLWASVIFVVASGAVLGYAAYRYRQILNVTAFFIKAATVYVLVEEEDARLAAMAAGKGAKENDRAHMRQFLGTLSDSFAVQKRSMWNRQIERSNHLMNELGNASTAESLEAREQLRRRNEAYLRALKSGDAAVFVRRYP